MKGTKEGRKLTTVTKEGRKLSKVRKLRNMR
jgi:hypothetical protein